MKSHFLFICLISYSYLFSQNLDEDKYYAETKTIFIESEIFGKKRELQVFFPDEYFWHPEKKFSVLYLLDAQNFRIFNYVKGNIELLSMNYMEPMIIVGIATEDRWFEFLPKNNHPETLKVYNPPIGGADKLVFHIKNEVESYIKNNFRVNKKRWGLGHSLGATFLMYFNTKEKDFFDYNILLSPNFSYDKEQMIDRIKDFVKKSVFDREKVFHIYSGYGDSYEEQFNLSLKKINSWIKAQKKHNFIWKYERLNINSHDNVWLEGVYKGLLRQ